jgi:hypothetical protein
MFLRTGAAKFAQCFPHVGQILLPAVAAGGASYGAAGGRAAQRRYNPLSAPAWAATASGAPLASQAAPALCDIARHDTTKNDIK